MQPAFTVAVALICVNAALAIPLLGEIQSGLTNALTGKRNSGNKEVPAVTVAPDVAETLNNTVAATTDEVQNLQTWTTEATDVLATETPAENAATEETATAGAVEDDNEDPVSSAISKLSALPVAQFLGL